MDTCGLGDESNGRAADALRMAEGKDWEYVAANIDGFSANGYGTVPNLWPKIMDQAKKKPTWVMHGTTVASEFINKKEYFVPLYDAELKRQNVDHRVYGWLVYFDGDPPNGRQWEPGVVTKWKNFEPFAKVTPRIFGRTNGPEIYLCWEKACEDNYSALRESDGWVYEATPDVVAESLMNDPKEWPDHRLAWKKLHEECKKYNKKMLWLMATTGKGSLKEAQDSFRWLKKENLLPDVIIVSNYGTEDNGRKDYRAIPEGKGDDYPDTVTGIARWLLVNR